MSSPRRSGVRQLSSHSALYDRAPLLPASSGTRRDVPDAIIVPTSRLTSNLSRLIDLATSLGTMLVVLCSQQATVEKVVERMERRIGARGVVARVDGDDAHPMGCFATSDTQFATANGGRCSDLSRKRNAGLRLARLRGWKKIVFIDDDMTVDAADIIQIARQLDRSPIAGMRSVHYPDNSVVCHARRLAKLPQDVFLSGAVLGVNCAGRDLGFFPDVYNEDWFFFGEAAAAHRLPKPGPAYQAEYKPFASPDRARHEEFGDLLAEGVYSLIESSGLDSFESVVQHATESYWSDFIEVRLENIGETRELLTRFVGTDNCNDDVDDALVSLDESASRYGRPDTPITADLCVAFLEGWRKDTADWRNGLPEPLRRARLDDAMEWLGITDWRTVRSPIRVERLGATGTRSAHRQPVAVARQSG